MQTQQIWPNLSNFLFNFRNGNKSPWIRSAEGTGWLNKQNVFLENEFVVIEDSRPLFVLNLVKNMIRKPHPEIRSNEESSDLWLKMADFDVFCPLTARLTEQRLHMPWKLTISEELFNK